MFRNYLKIALRSLARNPVYSMVNILGLTAGISACLLIGLYIWNETHYDNFHANAGRIMRVTMAYGEAGTVNKAAVTGTKVGPEFARKFPAVESFVRTMKDARVITYGEKTFREENLLFADSTFFRIFSFRLVSGDPGTCLNAPDRIVISEDMARKYFGKEEAMGKTLRVGDDKIYTVSGIAEKVPGNSQIHFDVVLPFSNLRAARQEEQWFTANYVTYLLLHQASQQESLQRQVTGYMAQVSKKELFTEGDGFLTHYLEPLESVHLHSSLDGLEPNGNIVYVYVLGIIALLILFIAGVNFSNLATAQSAGRGTEVGIRKVLGAQRGQLWIRFLGESFLLTLVSAIFALIITIALLPLFSQLAGVQITPQLLFRRETIILLGVIIVLVSLLAGAYPAFLLSGSRLGSVLKSGIRVTAAGGNLRRGMIVFQFVISVFLIIATIIVIQQLSYIREKDLGYDREKVLVLPGFSSTRAEFEDFKRALSQVQGVKSVSGAYESPVFVQWSDGITAENGGVKKDISVKAIPTDLNFITVMNMRLIAGRDFNEADLADLDTAQNGKNFRYSFILNERAVREMGLSPEEAIGRTVSKGAPGTIRGVVKDFHFSSLHEPIGPLVLFLEPDMVRQVYIKLGGNDNRQTIAALEKFWKERLPQHPFTFHFMDEDYNNLYTTEQRTAKIFSLFAGLAILLACMGLFALSAYTTVQRTREIGIRKVMGASVAQIMMLLSTEFLILVALAILIATPLAWLAGSRWLQDFAYRISIRSWMFILASGMALVVALAAVSLQTLRAARSNPVKCLRTE